MKCVYGLLLCCALLLGQSGTFTSTGSMAAPRYYHSATLLLDGRVLVLGSTIDNTAEVYDPSTGTFQPTGPLIVPKVQSTATLLPSGKVLIVGGTSGELYDPGTGTFSPTGPTVFPQYAASATLLPNGKVLISRGGASWPRMQSAELYDPETNTFKAAGAYASNELVMEVNPPATLLPNGQVLLTGTKSSQLYDYSTDTFRAIEAWSGAGTATVLGNGLVLMAGGGGFGDWPWAPTAELLDLATGKVLPAGFIERRSGQTASLLADGSVLFTGGTASSCQGNFCTCCVTLNTGARYDPVANLFLPAGQLASDRVFHRATVLNDGRVLITGGLTKVGLGQVILDTAEIFTPERIAPPLVLLSAASDGGSQGAVLFAGTGKVVSAKSPAAPGDVIEIYVTGLIAESVIPPQIWIQGRVAELVWFGPAPGHEGLYQMNVKVPNNTLSNATAPVRMSYQGRYSNEVTIGLR